ncbi:MAG: helix-turn-helix domain-containing protein [Bdellovibrionales bacterium]
MSVKNYPLVNIDSPGRFRLVPEADLLSLLADAEAVKKAKLRSSEYLKVHPQVARLVVSHRIKKELLQKDVAKLTKISHRTITEIENEDSKMKPRFKVVRALLGIFDDQFRKDLEKLIPLEAKKYNVY